MVQFWNLPQYYEEYIYFKLDQKIDSSYPLHDIEEKYSKELAWTMCTNGLCIELALVTTFSSALHRDASSVYILFDETEGRKVVNSGFLLIFHG